VGANSLEGVNLLNALKVSIHNPDAILSNKLGFNDSGRKTFFATNLKSTRGFCEHVREEESCEPKAEQSCGG
jgi:hypothetical protein